MRYTYCLQPLGMHENGFGGSSPIHRNAGDTTCSTLWNISANYLSIGNIGKI